MKRHLPAPGRLRLRGAWCAFPALLPFWSAPTLAQGGAVSCPIAPATEVVVYAGSGASALGQSWMRHFFDWWAAQQPEGSASPAYMFLSAAQVQACNLADRAAYPALRLYVQPGGDAYLAQRALGAAGKARIAAFLAGGGAYFGACAGWYYAAGEYVWQGISYAHADLLGAYPSRIEGSIREIADFDVGTGYAITALAGGRRVLYWGGPTAGYAQTGTLLGTVRARLRYRNLPAAVSYGRMLLTSVHLEAFEGDGIAGLATTERESNYRLLGRWLNQTARTAFRVPPEPPPPAAACDDGQDNDQDALVDMADPGCASPSDRDERDALPAPREVLFDTFEEGLDWTPGGAGAPWTRRNGNGEAYDGLYSAGAVATGGASTITRRFTLRGYNSATLSYVRRLQGIDAADEFRVSYFDGSWHVLEATARAAEDAGFRQMSFTLPVTATHINFRCLTNAPGEGCFVDNVRIVAR